MHFDRLVFVMGLLCCKLHMTFKQNHVILIVMRYQPFCQLYSKCTSIFFP